CSATTGGIISSNGTLAFSGNSTGATNSGPGEDGFTTGVSWESFTLTECVSSLVVDWCDSDPARASAYINLFIDCPYTSFIGANEVLNDCANGSRRHIYTNLSAGTYYIAISEDPAIGSGPYALSIEAGDACPPPPANDECADAIVLDASGTTCTPTAGTTIGATNSGIPGCT